MSQKIKTKEITKNIKEKAAETVKDKVSTAGIRTREATVGEATEQVRNAAHPQRKSDDQSVESHSTEKVEDTVKYTTEKAVRSTDKAVRKGVESVKEKVKEKRAEKEIVEQIKEENADSEAGLSPVEKTAEQKQQAQVNDNSPAESKTENSESAEPKRKEQKQAAQTESKRDIKEHSDDNGSKEPTEIRDSNETNPKINTEKANSSSSYGKDNKNISPKNDGQRPPDNRKQASKRSVNAKTGEAVTGTDEPRNVESLKQSIPKTPKEDQGPPNSRNQVPTRKEHLKTGKTVSESNETRKVKSRKQSPPKPKNERSIKTLSAAEKSVKTASSEGKTIKGTKETAETSKRAIKTADNAFKSAEKAVENTKKTVEKTAKAARKSAELSKKAAKAAVKAGEKLVKAVIEAAKAVAAGAKTLVAAAAGGSVVAIVIIVILLIAAIGGTCFGIFLTNDETTGTEMLITDAMSALGAEYYSSLSEGEYDSIEVIGNTAINWREVLSVYAVRYTNMNGGFNVATIGDEQLEGMRTVLNDMNPFSVVTEVRTTTVNTYHEDGTTTSENVQNTFLVVTAEHHTAAEQAAIYGMSEEEIKQLAELARPEYDDIWSDLIRIAGNGQIVSVALSQLGNVGGEPYWRYMGFTYRIAWCASFVSWCANQCGYIQTGLMPSSTSCGVMVAWYQTKGLWHDRAYVPSPGDIIFFDWQPNGFADHVGIVERVENGRVYTIEGNSGNACKQQSYPLGNWQIFGYGTPNIM